MDNALRDAKLQFKDIDEVILVGGSTRIPVVQELVKKMTGKDPNVTVNPDEVVALGAAVQVSSQATLVTVILEIYPNCPVSLNGVLLTLQCLLFISPEVTYMHLCRVIGLWYIVGIGCCAFSIST